MADDGVLICRTLQQSAATDSSSPTGCNLIDTSTSQHDCNPDFTANLLSVDKTLKQAAQRVADIEADQSFRDHSDGTAMSNSGNQSIGGTPSSSARSPVRMLVRSRSVLGRLPSYAQPTVSSLLRSSHSNDLLDVNTAASQICSRCRPRSVSPILHKGKYRGSRSKADRLTSARASRGGGASSSLSMSAVSTPGQLQSPRPRSAVRSTSSIHKSGVHSEVNSKPSTPVLMNSPVKSSIVGRTTPGPERVVKDSKPPLSTLSVGLDNDVKAAREIRRKQLNEMSKSFELDLTSNKGDKKKTQKSKPIRSNSTSEEVRAKLATEDDVKAKSTEEEKCRPKSLGTNVKTQSMVHESGKHSESNKKRRNPTEHAKLRDTKEQVKTKATGDRGHKSQESGDEGSSKTVIDRHEDKSTLDKVKPKQETALVDKQKPKPVADETRGKPVEDKIKSKVLLTEKSKAKSAAEENKKAILTDDDDKDKSRSSDKSKTASDGKVKVKPATGTKSGQEDVRKKSISEVKGDTAVKEAEPKLGSMQDTKKDKANVISTDSPLKNLDGKPRVDSDSPAVNAKKDSESDAAVDEYKAKLTENRRLAREKAEREAAEEEARLKRLQQEEEERRCREEEEERLREAEELRIAEEMRKSEEERLQRAVEAEEKRKKEEQIQLEKERVQRLEAERLAKEEAARLEIERQARIKRDEEEKIERKKRLESIMKRVKTDDSISKNDSAGVKNETAASEEITPAPAVESGVPQFKSARLQQMLGSKSASSATSTGDESSKTTNSGSESVVIDKTSAIHACCENAEVVEGAEWEIRDTNGITLIPIANTTPAPRLLQETN